MANVELKPSDKPEQPPDEGSGIGFDDLLRRMLATPPAKKKPPARKRGG